MITDTMNVGFTSGEPAGANFAIPNLMRTQQTKAQLWLMSPKNITNFTARPLVYQFGSEFQDVMREVIDKKTNRAYNPNPDEFYLRQNPKAAASILPNAQGDIVNTSLYSNEWTFILVIEKDDVAYGKHRDFYSGIAFNCDIANQHAINPSTILQFTHVSSLDNTCYQGRSRTVSTQDIDVIDMNALTSLHGAAMYDLHPSATVNDTIAGADNTSELSMFTSQDNAYTDSVGKVKINTTDFNCAEKHLHNVTSGIVDAIATSGLSADQSLYGAFDRTSSVASIAKSSFGCSRTNSITNISGTAIRADKTYSLGELDGMFNNALHVAVLNQPTSNNLDLNINTQAPSKRNVFTSMLMDSLNFILSTYGIASVAFTYQSSTGDGLIRGTDTSAISLHSISDLMGCDDATVRHSWELAMFYLRAYTFPLIKSAAGDDFRVDVQASQFANTFVCLNFLSDPYDPTFSEICNTLGSINTSMVGNRDVFTHNESEITGAIAGCANYAFAGLDDRSSFIY